MGSIGVGRNRRPATGSRSEGNEKYKIIKGKRASALEKRRKVFCQLWRSKFVTGRVTEMAKPCQSALAETLGGRRKLEKGEVGRGKRERERKREGREEIVPI